VPGSMDLSPGESSKNEAWQKLSLILLGIVGLGCTHALLYHLNVVIVPFLLGGFIVLALQPTVEIIFRLLAGLAGSQRWCCCCAKRRKSSGWTPRDEWSPSSARFGGPAKDEFCCGVKQDSCLGRQDIESTPLLPRQLSGHSTPGGRGSASDSDEAGEGGCWVTFLDSCCRVFAVTIVFLIALFCVFLVILGLAHGAMHLRQQWGSYADGLKRLESISDRVVEGFANEFNFQRDGKTVGEVETLQHIALKRMQETVFEVVEYIVHGTSDGITGFGIMLLYVLFWLYQPLPTGGRVGIVVRSYLFLKTICSAGLGISVAIAFALIGIDLAILFGMIAFFLNYVPEIGVIISTLIPVPVIMLDGRLENPFRVLMIATFVQCFLKFVWCNIVEVKLIEMDKEMNIHPVWVIGGLSYFGYIWGPIGMLISVPLLAIAKTAAMSASIVFPYDPDVVRFSDLFLACLEGRKVQKQAWQQSPRLADALTAGGQKFSIAIPSTPRMASKPASK